MRGPWDQVSAGARGPERGENSQISRNQVRKVEVKIVRDYFVNDKMAKMKDSDNRTYW